MSCATQNLRPSRPRTSGVTQPSAGQYSASMVHPCRSFSAILDELSSSRLMVVAGWRARGPRVTNKPSRATSRTTNRRCEMKLFITRLQLKQGGLHLRAFACDAR